MRGSAAVAILLGRCCWAGRPDRSAVTGGFVKLDFMLGGGSVGRGILLTRENSTMFSHSAPIPPAAGVWGELVPFFPPDACQPLQRSNYTRMLGTKMQFTTIGPYPHVVALVARGNCSFEEKFDHVDNVPNVIGLIMYDLPNGENLATDIEISTFRPTRIPGFLIDHRVGAGLLRELDRMRNATGPRRPVARPWIKATLQYQPLSGPLVGVLQLVLLLAMGLLAAAFSVSVYMHYRLYRMQQRLGRDRLNAAREAIKIDETFLQKLGVARFHRCGEPADEKDFGGVHEKVRSGGKGEDAPEQTDHQAAHCAPPNETCPICLDEFAEGECLNVLPCGHYYHMSCIQPWLQHRSAECPMCKVDVRDGYLALGPAANNGRLILGTLGAALSRTVHMICYCFGMGDAEERADSSMSEVRIHTPPVSIHQHQRDGTMNSVSLAEGQPGSSQ